MKERINGVFDTCDRHAKRLEWAKSKLSPLMPITAKVFVKLAPEQVAIFELFTNRFAKLQDLMGAKLFPLILELTEEQQVPMVFIDIINRLEKIGALPSVQRWLEFRDTRNQFTHDYPDDSEQNAAVLNNAFHEANDLLAYLEHIKRFAEKYLKKS